MKFHSLIFSSVVFAVIALSCSTSRRNIGYAKIVMSASRDSVDKARKKILDLPNTFSAHRFTSAKGTSLNYRLLQPEVGVQKKKLPLIVV